MKRKTNTQGKGMYCPVCKRGKIFMVPDTHEAAQIRLLGPRDADLAACFAKCGVCGTQVGIAIRQLESRREQIPTGDAVAL